MKKQLVLAIFAVLFVLGAPDRSFGETVSLQWDDLGPMVAGREIEIVLPDGIKLKGNALAVREDHLVLNVKKTSNKAVYPKGQHSIERNLISSMDLRQKTIRWRVIATIAGSVIGVVTGAYIGCVTDSAALGIMAMIGIPVGSNVGALPADVKVTKIQIVGASSAN